MGQRCKALRKAIELIGNAEGIRLCGVSSFYETEPWGVKDQPDFINCALHIRTALPPLGLLGKLQEIEAALGRVRGEHWGARTMDIDILWMEGTELDHPRLSIPHPLITERAFVLRPLAQIAEGTRIGSRKVAELLSLCRDNGKVSHFKGSPTDFSLEMIACADSRWGIGRGGELLFKIPEDLKRFREMTLGHTVIMGRKTWDSLPGGKPLEGRYHIVMSRRGNISQGKAVCCVHSLEELWEVLEARSGKNFVIGGGEIYRLLLPYCAKAWITKVETDAHGDTFMPDLDDMPEFGREEPDFQTGLSWKELSVRFECYGRRGLQEA